MPVPVPTKKQTGVLALVNGTPWMVCGFIFMPLVYMLTLAAASTKQGVPINGQYIFGISSWANKKNNGTINKGP